MNDNLKLWNAVSVTDPSKTKKLGYGSNLTAIDAYSQIKAATEQFGPAGEGWGWSILGFQYPPNDTVIVHLRLWHEGGGTGFDVCGQASLYTKGKDKRPDDDCAKKALTDAITKGLSYLGFNADVFEGKFDDSKYVAELVKNQEKADKAAAGPVGDYLDKRADETADLPRNEQEWKDWTDKFKVVVDSCPTTEAINASMKGVTARLKAMEKADPKGYDDLRDHVQGRREILETPTRDERDMLGAG